MYTQVKNDLSKPNVIYKANAGYIYLQMREGGRGYVWESVCWQCLLKKLAHPTLPRPSYPHFPALTVIFTVKFVSYDNKCHLSTARRGSTPLHHILQEPTRIRTYTHTRARASHTLKYHVDISHYYLHYQRFFKHTCRKGGINHHHASFFSDMVATVSKG